MHWRTGLLMWVLTASLLPPPALGEESAGDYQELDLEELLNVVVTPTRRIQSVPEAPAAIAVITARQIALFGYRSVGEALAAVTGIAVIDDHVYQHVGVRGLFADFGSPNDHLKVMINGQPVSFRPNSAGLLGEEFIPIEAVKRIEVLRGPGSALYGANALLGVVNVITWTGREGHLPHGGPGGDIDAVRLEASYSQTERAVNPGRGISARAGGSKDWGHFFVAASFHAWERSGLLIPGYADMVARRMRDTGLHDHEVRGYPSPGWGRAAREGLLARAPSRDDDARTGSFYGLGALDLGPGTLQLDASAQYMEKDGEFQEFSYLTHGNRISYLNWFTRLRYVTQKARRGLGFDTSLALSGGRPVHDHLLDPLLPGAYKSRRFGYLAVDALAEVSYTFAPGTVICGGVDFSVDFEDLLTMEVFPENAASFLEPGHGDKLFTNVGGYLQAAWTIANVTLTAGSRLDYDAVIGCNPDDWACFGRDGDQGLVNLSNRAGIIWRPPWWGLYVKAMYGSSFRPPSPYQLYHRPATVVGSKGNPGLLPQTADTVELLAGTMPVPELHAYIGAYYTAVDDLVLGYLDGNTFQARNADAETWGLEGGLDLCLDRRWSAFINASYLLGGVVRPGGREDETSLAWQTSVFNDEVDIGMYPRVMGNLGLAVHEPESHLRAALQLHYTGERKASLVNNLLYNNTSLNKTYELDGYLTASLTVATVGLSWWGTEPVFSASARYVPGRYYEPGKGGIDIPGPAARLYFSWEQRF